MRSGPFALGLLVLVVLCTASPGARAAGDPFASGNGTTTDWCVRGDDDRSSDADAAAPARAAKVDAAAVAAPARPARIVDRIVEKVDRIVASHPLVYESRATVASPTWASPLAPGPESLLCANGGYGADCQARDPAERPVPPSPISVLEQVLAPTDTLALQARDARIVAFPLGALGAARPGFDRGLDRPPRA